MAGNDWGSTIVNFLTTALDEQLAQTRHWTQEAARQAEVIRRLEARLAELDPVQRAKEAGGGL